MNPFSTIMTSPIRGIGRIPVDSQQTSFEDNTGFAFFDRTIGLDDTEQLVYKVTLTNPVNLTLREIELFTGGREYLAYPDTGTHTFTGTLEPAGTTTPENQNLGKNKQSFPVTGVTIEKAIGEDIFTPDAAVKPTAGSIIVSSGNANQATTQYNADSRKLGIPGGVSFFLVMNHLGSTVPTHMLFRLRWEELFL